MHKRPLLQEALPDHLVTFSHLSPCLYLDSFIHLSAFGVLGLCCWGDFAPVAGSQGYSHVAEHRLWGTRTSVVAAPGLWSTGSTAVTHGLSCSVACGIFPDQGSNRQAYSLRLSHQGRSPLKNIYLCIWLCWVLVVIHRICDLC